VSAEIENYTIPSFQHFHIETFINFNPISYVVKEEITRRTHAGYLIES